MTRLKRLRKQWRGWWFETPSRSLWRHCNELLLNKINVKPFDTVGYCAVDSPPNSPFHSHHTELWCRTYISINYVIIGSVDGLASKRRQVITETNRCLSPLDTDQITITVPNLPSKKLHVGISSSILLNLRRINAGAMLQLYLSWFAISRRLTIYQVWTRLQIFSDNALNQFFAVVQTEGVIKLFLCVYPALFWLQI